jgi:hypothetical protein
MELGKIQVNHFIHYIVHYTCVLKQGEKLREQAEKAERQPTGNHTGKLIECQLLL